MVTFLLASFEQCPAQTENNLAKEIINKIKLIKKFNPLKSYLQSIDTDSIKVHSEIIKDLDIIDNYNETIFKLGGDPVTGQSSLNQEHIIQIIKKEENIIYIGIGHEYVPAFDVSIVNPTQFAKLKNRYENLYDKIFDPNVFFYQVEGLGTYYSARFIGEDPTPSSDWQVVDYLISTKNIQKLDELISSCQAADQFYGYLGLRTLKNSGIQLTEKQLEKIDVVKNKKGRIDIQFGDLGDNIEFQKLVTSYGQYDLR